jgi:hypothetical protein
MKPSNLQRNWQFAADALSLDIEIPFDVALKDSRIQAEVLLRGYGAKLGMLIASDYSIIEGHHDELIALGYGFSCMSQPSESEVNSLEGFQEILDDWMPVSSETQAEPGAAANASRR